MNKFIIFNKMKWPGMMNCVFLMYIKENWSNEVYKQESNGPEVMPWTFIETHTRKITEETESPCFLSYSTFFLHISYVIRCYEGYEMNINFKVAHMHENAMWS
jgi:hypothetical protein